MPLSLSAHRGRWKTVLLYGGSFDPVHDGHTALSLHVAAALASIGQPADRIPLDAVRKFCKNIGNVRAVHLRSLEEETKTDVKRAEVERLLAGGDKNIVFYLMLRAADRFASERARMPGTFDESDFGTLRAIAQQLLGEYESKATEVLDDPAQEFCRWAGAELHNPSAVLGGIASQEAIKLLTSQFVPVCNTVIVNGIDCSSSAYEL